MAPTRWDKTYHAVSVEACWTIAYLATQRYAKLATRFSLTGKPELAAACRACRDVADQIARRIKYGPERRYRRRRPKLPNGRKRS